MSNNTILPEDIINNPPSILDGISVQDEKLHRIFGCELIQEAGILMKLPQVIMATGQGIFHRFYYRKSMKKFDVFTVAMGSLMLATKVEENMKIVREIVFVFHHIYQVRKKLILTPLKLEDDRYHLWKENVLLIERYILKELGFSLYNIMDHPHKYILYYLKLLEGSYELSQVAWNYLNDSLRLDLSLCYHSQDIACAAIYLASRTLHYALPTTPPWWSIMTDNFDQIEDIAESILELYTYEKMTWLEPYTIPDYLLPEICKKYDIPLSAVTSTSTSTNTSTSTENSTPPIHKRNISYMEEDSSHNTPIHMDVEKDENYKLKEHNTNDSLIRDKDRNRNRDRKQSIQGRGRSRSDSRNRSNTQDHNYISRQSHSPVTEKYKNNNSRSPQRFGKRKQTDYDDHVSHKKRYDEDLRNDKNGSRNRNDRDEYQQDDDTNRPRTESRSSRDRLKRDRDRDKDRDSSHNRSSRKDSGRRSNSRDRKYDRRR